MLKSFLNRALRRCLDEVFVDLDHDGGAGFKFNLNLLSGSGRSSLVIQEQQIRPDLFDVVLQPIALISGTVGEINIEGLAELTSSTDWNTPLKIQIANIHLLFKIDAKADAERVQFLRKLLLELQSETYLSAAKQKLLGDILSKLFSTTLGSGENKSAGSKKGPNTSEEKRRRKMLLRSLTLLFKYTDLIIKGFHVRIETDGDDDASGKSVGALGWSFASLRAHTAKESERPDLVAADALLFSCNISNLQCYADYERPSYATSVPIRAAFAQKDAHIALVMPADVRIILAAEIQARGAVIVPTFSLTLGPLGGPLTMVSDWKQMSVLVRILIELRQARVRFAHLCRVSSLFGNNFPRLVQTRGLHLLPTLRYQGRLYPTDLELPTGTSHRSLAHLFKLRQQPLNKAATSKPTSPWARAMWRHVIRLVQNDVRKTLPMGRWREVARMCFFRKQYAFLYGRTLSRGGESSGASDSSSETTPLAAPALDLPPFEQQDDDTEGATPADKAVSQRLLLMEMALPQASILLFRQLGVIIAFVEERNSYLARSSKSRSSTNGPVLVALSWRDVLRLNVALIETAREQTIWREVVGKKGDHDVDGDDGRDDEDNVVPLSQLIGQLVSEEGERSTAVLKDSPAKAKSSIRSTKDSLAAISANLEFRHYQGTTGSRLTNERVIDVVRLGLKRHASPVQLLLPCLTLTLDEVVFQVRLPVTNGRRATLVITKLKRVVGSLLSSQTARPERGGKIASGALLCLRFEVQEVVTQVAQLPTATLDASASTLMLPLAKTLSSSGPNALSLCIILDVSSSDGVAGDFSLHLPDIFCALDPGNLSFFSCAAVREPLRQTLLYVNEATKLLSGGCAMTRFISVSRRNPESTTATKHQSEFKRYARWLELTAPLLQQRTLTASCHVGRLQMELPPRIITLVARERARDLAARARDLYQEQSSTGDADVADADADADAESLRTLTEQLRDAVPAATSPIRALIRIVLDSRLWHTLPDPSAPSAPSSLSSPYPSAAPARLAIPAVEFLVSKRPLEGEGKRVEVDVRVGGLECTMPVSERSLHRAVAATLHVIS